MVRCRRERLGTIGETCEMGLGLGLRLGLGLGLGLGLRFGLSGVDWETGVGASLDGTILGLAWTGLDVGWSWGVCRFACDQ